MVFIDGNFLTCQSSAMLYNMLDNHIYSRWANYGSLTGITEYSMVCVTTSDEYYLARNFLTEYVEMMTIVLVQRASLLNFERKLSDAAYSNGNIKKIHKDYVNFQSQILLKEITPQQQGIELYSMLKKNMFIDEYTSEIKDQIEALYAQKTADNESWENSILFILSVLSVFEATDLFAEWASGTCLGFIPTSNGSAKLIFTGVIIAIICIFKKLIKFKK